MKNPLGNMGNILKQAQAMQAQMAKVQEQAASKTVTGTAGGGSVTVTANGGLQIVGIVIDPEVVKSRRCGDGARFSYGCVERRPQEGSRDDGGCDEIGYRWDEHARAALAGC